MLDKKTEMLQMVLDLRILNPIGLMPQIVWALN